MKTIRERMRRINADIAPFVMGGTVGGFIGTILFYLMIIFHM